MRRFLVMLLVLLLVPGMVRGQLVIGPSGPVIPGEEPPRPHIQPTVYTISITPSNEPVPALRYRFDIPLMERQPGNSVPFYYRAIATIRVFGRVPRGAENLKSVGHYLETPIEDLDVKAAKEAIAMWSGALEQLETATYREETDWSWRVGELPGKDAYGFLLPEIQNARELARVVALRARVEIAEGRYQDAERSLRMGYRLSAAIAVEPFAICALVGAASSSHMDEAVIDWISRPGSPSAYWALAALPGPLIKVRPAMEYELNAPLRIAPWLENAASDRAPPDVWQTRIVDLLSILVRLDVTEWAILVGEGSKEHRDFLAIEATILALRSYPRAKEALVKHGHDPEKVAAMPVGKVLAIQENYVAQRIIDARLRMALVPPTQFDAVEADTRKMLQARNLAGPSSTTGREPLPLMTAMPTFVEQLGTTINRSYARRLALRTIEAIRLHAATTGALPKSLNEIKVVPVPDNPFTDEPFQYAVKGNTAVLTAIADPEKPWTSYRFELTLNSASGSSDK